MQIGFSQRRPLAPEGQPAASAGCSDEARVANPGQAENEAGAPQGRSEAVRRDGRNLNDIRGAPPGLEFIAR